MYRETIFNENSLEESQRPISCAKWVKMGMAFGGVEKGFGNVALGA